MPSAVVGSFTAGPGDIYGCQGVEIMAWLIRDEQAAQWVHDPWALDALRRGQLHLGVLASLPGQWQAYYQDCHEVADLPWGEVAYFELPGSQDVATWWFYPQSWVALELWLFLYHNGDLVPFTEPSPGRAVDDNGGIRLEVAL